MKYKTADGYPIMFYEKTECTGCGICALSCPAVKIGGKGAIEMCADKEGFFYPKLDLQKCVRCYACIAVCHFK